MRTIDESNKHILSAIEIMDSKPEFDAECEAGIQAQLASAKALQAVAFAIRELANQTNRMRGRVN